MKSKKQRCKACEEWKNYPRKIIFEVPAIAWIQYGICTVPNCKVVLGK